MNTKLSTVRALAALMKEAGLTSLELKEPDFYLKLEKTGAAVSAAPTIPDTAPCAAPQSVSGGTDDPGMDFNKAKVITSPMVGVFYAAPAPDREPFVQIGSRVKAGDPLCIIEAMKLMNEITADCDGEIVDICAANGDVVEFGQTLFKII